MSHPTANKIYIIKQGEKFPPLLYDAEAPPSSEAYVDDYDRRSSRTLTRAAKVLSSQCAEGTIILYPNAGVA